MPSTAFFSVLNSELAPLDRFMVADVAVMSTAVAAFFSFFSMFKFQTSKRGVEDWTAFSSFSLQSSCVPVVLLNGKS